MQLPAPVIYPNGGGISIFDTIKMSCEVPDATIYYTIDGSVPNIRSSNTMRYNPLECTRIYSLDDKKDHGVIKAMAVKIGFANSEVTISNEFVFYATNPWHQIAEAVSKLSQGNQIVNITYSFMLPGTQFDNCDPQSGALLSSKTLPLTTFQSSSTQAQFMQTCVDCLQMWKLYLENIFTPQKYKGKLIVNFVPAPNSINGFEQNNTIPSKMNTYYPSSNQNGIGDIRFGIGSLEDTEAFTAMPLGPKEGQISSIHGDVIINGNLRVRRENQPFSAKYANLKFIILHELGHVLGGLIDDPYGLFGAKLMAHKLSYLSDNPSLQSPIFYNLSALFPNGFNADTPWEKQRVEELYTIYKPNYPIIPPPSISPIPNTPITSEVKISIISTVNDEPKKHEQILYAIDDANFQSYIEPIHLTKNAKIDAVSMLTHGLFTESAISEQFAMPTFSNINTNRYTVTTYQTKPVTKFTGFYDTISKTIKLEWTKDPSDTATVKFRIYYGINNGLSTNPANVTKQPLTAEPIETVGTAVSLFGGIINTPYWFTVKTVNLRNQEDNPVSLDHTITPILPG